MNTIREFFSISLNGLPFLIVQEGPSHFSPLVALLYIDIAVASAKYPDLIMLPDIIDFAYPIYF